MLDIHTILSVSFDKGSPLGSRFHLFVISFSGEVTWVRELTSGLLL